MFQKSNKFYHLLIFKTILLFSSFAESFQFQHNYEFGYGLKAVEEIDPKVELKKLLLTNPKQVLEDIKAIHHNSDLSFEDRIQAHPLSFLNECTKDICKLSRLLDPTLREEAVNIIIDQITTKFSTSTPLKIVSFASGDLFQDLVILLKLAEKEYDNITIKLVDLKWEKLLNVGLLNKHLSLYELDQITQNEENKKAIAQMLQFRAMLPKSWEISFYSKAESLYYESWQYYTHDVMWGMDYNEESYKEKTPHDFMDLTHYGLQEGGLAFELGFTKNYVYVYLTQKNTPDEVLKLKYF